MLFWKAPGKPAATARFAGCAVAVALSTTAQAFEQDATETGDTHDFAKAFLCGFLEQNPGRTAYTAWSLEYAHHATTLLRVLDAASSLGVRVVADATLADFRWLLTEYHTVTLFGHFRGWDITLREAADPAFLNAFRSLADPAWRRLRAAVQQVDPVATTRLLAGDGPADVDALATVMASRILFEDAGTDPQRQPYPQSYWPLKNPEALSNVLPALAQAGVYEFRDGMKRLDEVVTAIPERFAGAIDFIVCNSIFLAEAGQQRPAAA